MEDLGTYLRNLRLERNMTLREAAAQSGVSPAYLVQIEQGKRKSPGGAILKKLAATYGVPSRAVLRAAGYLDESSPGLTEDEEVDMAFKYVMSDRRYQLGTRLKEDLTTEVKRFIVEMYEKATGKKLLP